MLNSGMVKNGVVGRKRKHAGNACHNCELPQEQGVAYLTNPAFLLQGHWLLLLSKANPVDQNGV